MNFDGAGDSRGEAEEPGSPLARFLSREPDACERLERRERGESIERAVAELSDQLRSVVMLVYYQGLKYREAAEALSIPVGTVKSRLHAAIEQLGKSFQCSVFSFQRQDTAH